MMAAGRNGTIDELAAAGKIRGKQRHRLADTQGLPLHAVIRAVDSQDRDRGVLVMGALFGWSPFRQLQLSQCQQRPWT